MEQHVAVEQKPVVAVGAEEGLTLHQVSVFGGQWPARR
jgi:hypothetical protein